MIINTKRIIKQYAFMLAMWAFAVYSAFADDATPKPLSFTANIQTVDTTKLYEGLRYGYFFNTWTPPCFYYSSQDCFEQRLKEIDMMIALTTGEAEPYINQINSALEQATLFIDIENDSKQLSDDWYYQFYIITYTLLNKSLLHFHNGQPQEAIDQLSLIHKFIELYENTDSVSSDEANLYVISIRQLYTQYLDMMLNHGFLQPYLKEPKVVALFNFNEDHVRQLYIKKQMHQITHESQQSLETLPNIESVTTIDTLDDEELMLAVIQMAAYNKNHFISNNPELTQKIQNYRPKCEIVNELDDVQIVAMQDHEYFVTLFDSCLAVDSALRTASINDIILYFKNHYSIEEGIEAYQVAMLALLETDANNIMTLGFNLYEQQCQNNTPNKFCIRLIDLLSKTTLLDQVLAYQYLVHLKYEVLNNNIQPENIMELLQKPNNFIQNAQPVKKIIWDLNTQTLQTDIPASPAKQSIPVMDTNDRYFTIQLKFNEIN